LFGSSCVRHQWRPANPGDSADSLWILDCPQLSGAKSFHVDVGGSSIAVRSDDPVSWQSSTFSRLPD
jgi:hypothetical protein